MADEPKSTDEEAPKSEPDAPKSEPDAPKSGGERAQAPKVEGAVAQPTYRPPYWFLAVVSIASLGLDLVAKWWVTANLAPRAFTPGHPFDPNRSVEIIPDHVELIFAKNKGGAFGILQGEAEWIRKPFFFAISVAAVVFIVSLFRKLQPGQWALRWGLPLVLGGALGNLFDRIRYDYVVDFLDVRANWIGWVMRNVFGSAGDHWPTFNVADVAIVAGVGLMAIDMFLTRKTNKSGQTKPSTAAKSEPPSDASEPTAASESKL